MNGFWYLEREKFKELHGLDKTDDIGRPLLRAMADCSCAYCRKRGLELADEYGSAGVAAAFVKEFAPKNTAPKLRADYTRKFRVPGVKKVERVRWNKAAPKEPVSFVIPSADKLDDEIFNVALEVGNFQREIARTEQLLNMVIGDAQREDLETRLAELRYDLKLEKAKYDKLVGLRR